MLRSSGVSRAFVENATNRPSAVMEGAEPVPGAFRESTLTRSTAEKLGDASTSQQESAGRKRRSDRSTIRNLIEAREMANRRRRLDREIPVLRLRHLGRWIKHPRAHCRVRSRLDEDERSRQAVRRVRVE